MIDCGKIGCGISGSDAAVILPEGNIEHPVQAILQAIFHLPVPASDCGCAVPFSQAQQESKEG